MAIFCVITSYNNALIYKLNTFIKTKLEVNWRKKLKTIDRCRSPHIFLENTTDKLRLDFA